MFREGKGTLSTFYNGILGTIDRFVPASLQPIWKSPVGPRTVFFWAPACKWILIFASLSDSLNRPAKDISLSQCGVMATTGLIWSRWSLVIKPKNWNLFTVNVVIFLTQGLLACRALQWRSGSAHYAVYRHPNFATNIDDDW